MATDMPYSWIVVGINLCLFFSVSNEFNKFILLKLVLICMRVFNFLTNFVVRFGFIELAFGLTIGL
jgi:hypothetical protein